MTQPSAQRTIPAISLEVPKEGFDPPRTGSETAGEFSIVKGSETVQIQMICPIQNAEVVISIFNAVLGTFQNSTYP